MVEYEDSASQVYIGTSFSKRIRQKPCQGIVLNLSESGSPGGHDTQLLTLSS